MATHDDPCAERQRLVEDAGRQKNWKRWGPYLSERQWGTVREDYSKDGEAWDYFSHDDARSRAYRWGEDGLLGICDRQCRLAFALSLWNGVDPILKERLYGLTGTQGNHGEDVKEQYFYLDSTPTHSYMKALYKYPQAEFPYQRLVEENGRRGRDRREFELLDTGVFDHDAYFDIFAEYAKQGPDDILIRITVCNRSAGAARLHLLPTLWFRNTWSWGCEHEGCSLKPRIVALDPKVGYGFGTYHETLPELRLHAGDAPGGERPRLLFTENETNRKLLFGAENHGPRVKDGFHARVIDGDLEAANSRGPGTKVAAWYELELEGGESQVIELRLHPAESSPAEVFGAGFEKTVRARKEEADQFFGELLPARLGEEQRRVCRQGYAGLLWTKQFYHYAVHEWLEGDPNNPDPPAGRRPVRNTDWPHLFNRDVISMPDKWEYPWYAAWDLAFHMLPFGVIDPCFARDQIVLFLREWYMHPNGQLPAYEWNFSDVNPPVHAWAAWRLYKMSGPPGARDRTFLARVFLKLSLNFTWWVNQKDPEGNHLFSGGFLGLDNIGIFDRSRPLPGGGFLYQADGTAWMAFYCGTMLAMALELAHDDPAYEDMASKYFEHFVAIVDAMNNLGESGLWEEQDGFYYDHLRRDGQSQPLRIRSMVGLIPLFGTQILNERTLDRLPGFRKRMEWFLANRKDLSRQISYLEQTERDGETLRLLAVPSRERLERLLRYVLDESEFLSEHGVRSLSRIHRDHPFALEDAGEDASIAYAPGESNSAMFGGNSNWRGPIWFPLNFLLIESLEIYHRFYGDELQVECPVGSGVKMNLLQVAQELARRLTTLFLPDEQGRRPCHGEEQRFAEDPHWKDLLLFHEYFDGDTGRGLGASHQTGWTALVTRLLEKYCRSDGAACAPGEGSST